MYSALKPTEMKVIQSCFHQFKAHDLERAGDMGGWNGIMSFISLLHHFMVVDAKNF
jgi:hypothetical protein